MEQEQVELELKFPPDKPPFIGIRFENVFKASSLNKDLVENHNHVAYKFVIEPTGLFAKIRLIGDNSFQTREYLNISYKPEQIKKLLRIGRQCKFGHIIQIEGEDKPVKTSITYKLFVLMIGEIRVVQEY